MKVCAILVVLATAMSLLIHATEADAIVAIDGSGQYRSVQEAINASPQNATAAKPWTILVKPATYAERVYVQREKRFIRLVGEDAEKTIISYGLYADMKGPDEKIIGTFRTPTAQIDADDFTAENVTFENSAGPKGQALAVRIDGDRVVFRRCRFLGYQDTILGNRGRHYFVECTIAGAVDFIFGGATEYFEKCQIQCTGSGFITAASTPDSQRYGFVFSNCKITAEPTVKMYLGRPWRAYASVIFLNTELPAQIRPEGWHNWNDPAREKTARYAEYNSTGPGAASDKRVGWSKKLTEADAKTITVQSVLSGTDGYDPAAGK